MCTYHSLDFMSNTFQSDYLPCKATPCHVLRERGRGDVTGRKMQRGAETQTQTQEGGEEGEEEEGGRECMRTNN